MAAHYPVAVPDTPQHVDLSFAATLVAGAHLRRTLERLGLPLPLEEDAQLLATELVTNSVRHSGLGPEDVVSVTINWSGERLRVTVRDRTPTANLPIQAAIRPGPGAEAGWGLYLVDRMSDRWGTGASGYWFELSLGQYRRQR